MHVERTDQLERDMADQIKTKRREKFSPLEVLSTIAVVLMIGVVAVPFPYTSGGHGFPAAQPGFQRESAASGARSDATLKSSGTEKKNGSMARHGLDQSPFEVRTAGQREFCANQPGVVRFRTSGESCKNGDLVIESQPRSERLRP